ncbi:hypothetical protein PI124_g17028 [Phytophthora idaei]|nr:hypothetical protein PI126_g16158 [Phytophthora idaei]KAG3237998.1 hypothetical protein PI124_g17028 [Phytophthora idaei]
MIGEKPCRATCTHLRRREKCSVLTTKSLLRKRRHVAPSCVVYAASLSPCRRGSHCVPHHPKFEIARTKNTARILRELGLQDSSSISENGSRDVHNTGNSAENKKNSDFEQDSIP